MPNWCHNSLEVSGSEHRVKEFRDLVKAEDTDLSLNNLRPMPEQLKHTVAYGPEPNWDSWRFEHWGTKWDIEARIIEASSNNVQYEFLSAWDPPVAWLREAARQFPDLRFDLQYWEYGNAFEGRAIGQEGQVIDRSWPFIFKERE